MTEKWNTDIMEQGNALDKFKRRSTVYEENVYQKIVDLHGHGIGGDHWRYLYSADFFCEKHLYGIGIGSDLDGLGET